MIAVTSRKPAVAPPCSAGSSGFADQAFGKRHDRGQLVAPAVEFDPHELDIGHTVDKRAQGGIAALLDDLDRFGGLADHGFTPRPGSLVKAPLVVATGRVLSSSVAVARTNATVRVML